MWQVKGADLKFKNCRQGEFVVEFVPAPAGLGFHRESAGLLLQTFGWKWLLTCVCGTTAR